MAERFRSRAPWEAFGRFIPPFFEGAEMAPRMCWVLLATVMFGGWMYGTQASFASASPSTPVQTQRPIGLSTAALVAQSSQSSSSSSSDGISGRNIRSLVRIGIFLVVVLFGVGGWVVKKVSGK